jgi:hypothetical protein
MRAQLRDALKALPEAKNKIQIVAPEAEADDPQEEGSTIVPPPLC